MVTANRKWVLVSVNSSRHLSTVKLVCNTFVLLLGNKYSLTEKYNIIYKSLFFQRSPIQLFMHRAAIVGDIGHHNSCCFSLYWFNSCYIFLEVWRSGSSTVIYQRANKRCICTFLGQWVAGREVSLEDTKNSVCLSS